MDFLVSLLTEDPGGSPPDINAKTNEGNTALHLAVQVSGFSDLQHVDTNDGMGRVFYE